MDDIFDIFDINPTYGEILQNINFVKNEVENLDQDSLIDEVVGIQHNIIGKEADKIKYLMFKSKANEDFDEDEMEFLRNIYVVYYCQFAVVVDEPEEDDDEI